MHNHLKEIRKRKNKCFYFHRQLDTKDLVCDLGKYHEAHLSSFTVSLFLAKPKIKIDCHIVQRWYLCANCHFTWVQNAYYWWRVSIWNDCTLCIQWLVPVTLVAMGWASLILSSHFSQQSKPTILPRLHSLTPHHRSQPNSIQPTHWPWVFKYSCDRPVVA